MQAKRAVGRSASVTGGWHGNAKRGRVRPASNTAALWAAVPPGEVVSYASAEGQMSLRQHAAWSGLFAVQTRWPWQ